MTHCEQLLAALRRRWCTYGDLEALRISTCPWVRLKSAHRYLRDGESLEKRVRQKDGLVEMRVVKATRWTA